ncbi:MAG: zinc-binding dehydrogenase [Actinomycetota bacterium]
MKGRLAAYPPGVRSTMDLREVDVPDPAPGSILVRVTRANVCGSDLHFYRGDIDLSKFMSEPTVLGHEMCGVVASLGAGVSKDSAGRPLHEGDRVVYRYFEPCGSCSSCMRGQSAACGANLGFQRKACTAPPYFVGGFADYYMVPAGQAIFKVPDSLPDDLVVSVNCAVAEVVEGLTRARVGIGDCVVIQGAGGLGLYATALAKHLGAARVIVIDAIAERLSLAKEFGADDVIDISEHPDPNARSRALRSLNNGNGADVAVEVAGVPDAFTEGIALLGQGGRFVEIGNISLGLTTSFDPAQVTLGNKTVFGVVFYEPIALERALQFLSATREHVPYEKLVSSVYPLERINEAFDDAENRRVARASIAP